MKRVSYFGRKSSMKRNAFLRPSLPILTPGVLQMTGYNIYRFFSALSLDSLRLLSKATFLVWQGRWKDAETTFRDLSVQEYGSDPGEWARYMIGKAYWEGGDTKRAINEWKRLSQDGQYGWLRDRLHWEMASGLLSEASDTNECKALLNEVMTGEKETIFSDLSRLELKRGKAGSLLP